ncbi:hypothetical protein FRACYDRAFT_237285 [Fragilariopsis cylindrus CCMP1102]|uniref:Uncharacterized protein n=1 Tax=Fragilariopsis cylindrus CCMP1102 TaxID=635003 RepID=A0A1E7FLI8_9STRA|nr:hypothetical protein FRACYDRAFT_237285 [Fragilariopsis cylindrus CCMP1102]|eukprot:OEU18994.1 hypothetical protein FRACYDRAFT_237285 [Fragilariopsis cylindrus CCMP1102]
MDFALKTILGDLSLSGGATQQADTAVQEDNNNNDQVVQRLQIQEEGNASSSSSIKKLKMLNSGLFPNHRDPVLIYKAPSQDDSDDDTASTVDMDDDDEDEFPISPCPSPHTSSTRSPSSFLRRRNSSSKKYSDPSTRRSVRFEDEIVTSVYTRPTTTKDDKYYLHYDEYDYMDFKLEYRDDLLQASGRRTSSTLRRRRGSNNSNTSSSLYYKKSGSRKVSFKRDVVDSIHPVLDLKSRQKIHSDLFYSQNEMRTFLDEFVTSLQQDNKQQTTTTTTLST